MHAAGVALWARHCGKGYKDYDCLDALTALKGVIDCRYIGWLQGLDSVRVALLHQASRGCGHEAWAIGGGQKHTPHLANLNCSSAHTPCLESRLSKGPKKAKWRYKWTKFGRTFPLSYNGPGFCRA